MGKPFSHGGYRVEVEADGAIRVKNGDSLSKYSMAIHRDFKNMDKFGRLKNGSIETIPEHSRDRIFTGETIYYTGDKINGNTQRPESTCPTESNVPLTNEQKLQLVEDLRTRFNLTGDRLASVRWIVFGANVAQKGGTLGLIAMESSKIAATTQFAAAGAMVGVAGALLVPVAAVIGLTLARNYGVRQFALKSIAYNITRWAYSRKNTSPTVISPPREHMRLIRQNVPDDYQNYENVWRSSGLEAFRELNSYVVKQKVSRQSVKLLYQSIGKGVDTATATALMKALCEKAYKRQLDKDSFMTPTPVYPIQ